MAAAERDVAATERMRWGRSGRRPSGAAKTLRREAPPPARAPRRRLWRTTTSSPGRERRPRVGLWRWPSRRVSCAGARRGRKPRRGRETDGSRRRWGAWFSVPSRQVPILSRAHSSLPLRARAPPRSPIALTANAEDRCVVARGRPIAGQVAAGHGERGALLLHPLLLLLPPAAGDAAGPADAPSDHHRHLCASSAAAGVRLRARGGERTRSLARKKRVGGSVVVGEESCVCLGWSYAANRLQGLRSSAEVVCGVLGQCWVGRS
jgi:hypothetical protein